MHLVLIRLFAEPGIFLPPAMAAHVRGVRCIIGCAVACLSLVAIAKEYSTNRRHHTSFSQELKRDADGNLLQEIQHFGDAPVRGAPAGPDKERYAESDSASSSHFHHHRLHIPSHSHRHTRSKEEATPPKPSSKDSKNGHALRPVTTRQDSSRSLRNLKE